MYLSGLALLLMGILWQGPGSPNVEDFARMARLHDQEVAVFDHQGREHVGRLLSVTESTLTIGHDGRLHTIGQADILKAERTRDGVSDGVIRGLMVGLLVGIVSGADQSRSTGGFLVPVALFGAAGYLIDDLNTNRTLVYQAPEPPKPALKVSLRF